jgi:hypothetical protein
MTPLCLPKVIDASFNHSLSVPNIVTDLYPVTKPVIAIAKPVYAVTKPVIAVTKPVIVVTKQQKTFLIHN